MCGVQEPWASYLKSCATEERQPHFNKGLFQSLHGLMFPKPQLLTDPETTIWTPWPFPCCLCGGCYSCTPARAPSPGTWSQCAAGVQAGVEVGGSSPPTGTFHCKRSLGPRVGRAVAVQEPPFWVASVHRTSWIVSYEIICLVRFILPVSAMKWDLRLQLCSTWLLLDRHSWAPGTWTEVSGEPEEIWPFHRCILGKELLVGLRMWFQSCVVTVGIYLLGI